MKPKDIIWFWRGDERELPAMTNPSPTNIVVLEKNKSYILLLEKCLGLLSTQDLTILFDDIKSCVFCPDEESFESSFVEEYPESKFVFSDFCNVFLEHIKNYNTELTVLNENSFAIEIIKDLSAVLYKRLSCYTTGLDIDFITALSGTAYESKNTNGEALAILPSENWIENGKLKPLVVFEKSNRIDLNPSNVRAIRKQLNMCGDGALAIYKSEGDGKFKTAGLLSSKDACLFPRFKFPTHAEWVFLVPTAKNRECERLRYCNGSLMLPILDLTKKYAQRLETLNLTSMECNQIAKIINATNKCKHGAILIISDTQSIDSEAKRLTKAKRGTLPKSSITLIQGEKATPIMEQLASVDGAIFVDFTGNCFAFGVILDGVVQKDGSAARGSRYNSTKTYIEWLSERKKKEENKEPTLLGVVKSEDGMIDIFDNKGQL